MKSRGANFLSPKFYKFQPNPQYKDERMSHNHLNFSLIYKSYLSVVESAVAKYILKSLVFCFGNGYFASSNTILNISIGKFIIIAFILTVIIKTTIIISFRILLYSLISNIAIIMIIFIIIIIILQNRLFASSECHYAPRPL